MLCGQCSKSCHEDDVRIIRRCKHVLCCECLVELLKVITKPKVQCPIIGCSGIIHDKLIRECLSNDQLLNFEKFCVLNTSNKAFKCMTQDCSFLAIVLDDVSAFECDNCKAPNCLKCKKRHYPNDCGKNNAENAVELRAREFLGQAQRLEMEELQKKYYLLPNPSSFRCAVCKEFFLPRKGVILRNCLHTFCEDCLKGSLNAIAFISQMTCLDIGCRKPLDTGELLVLINETKLVDMMKREAATHFFQCKHENCPGMWHVTDKTELCECPECHRMNCVSCQDIHEGVTCVDFRKTKRYINSQGGSNVGIYCNV